MKNFFEDINVHYKPAEKNYWTGRQSNSELNPQYWHELIELVNLNEKETNTNIGIIGYSCDEGVKRNQGRIGAKEAPNFIRQHLAKLPIHFDSNHITDFGNLICINNDMEACQKALSKTVSHLISNNTFTMVLGGGHDIAYGHFMGIKEALKNKQKNKIGIINFDAHFDLRPIDESPNSGTPFNQIISESKTTNQPVGYFVIGIQQQSNTKELFSIAKENDVDYVSNFKCTISKKHIKILKKQLQSFIEQNDYLYISIDMDGFSSAYAPGVSAPSTLGFSPHFFFLILEFILKSNKVISCDIAEINPTLDIDNQTSKLASKIVDFIVCRI
ncbi:MAG: formimidoylglutamase [Algibacter sp.]